MKIYWFGKTSTKKVSEFTDKWEEVRDDLIELGMSITGNVITLPNNMKYIHGKTASWNGNDVTIESRYIGYSIGNIIVKVRVCEKTNVVSIETNQIKICQDNPQNKQI